MSAWSGWKLHDVQDLAQRQAAYNSLIQTIKDNDAKSRVAIKDYQEALESQTNNYIKLTQEAKRVKIFSNNCNINSDGIRLWNDSLKGIESTVPKDSTGTAKTTVPTSTITVEDLMLNKLRNDEICNGLRQQIESIIKWDKEVWNDFDSAGNTK